jgi:hypothetical protein
MLSIRGSTWRWVIGNVRSGSKFNDMPEPYQKSEYCQTKLDNRNAIRKVSGMTQALWSKMIAGLPKGLTAQRAARIFRHSETLVRRMLKKFGYNIAKKSHQAGKVPAWANGADWTQRNSVIAAKWGLTREAVRQMRAKLRKKKVGKRGTQPK